MYNFSQSLQRRAAKDCRHERIFGVLVTQSGNKDGERGTPVVFD